MTKSSVTTSLQYYSHSLDKQKVIGTSERNVLMKSSFSGSSSKSINGLFFNMSVFYYFFLVEYGWLKR